jgi:hypothetical protein
LRRGKIALRECGTWSVPKRFEAAMPLVTAYWIAISIECCDSIFTDNEIPLAAGAVINSRPSQNERVAG